MDAFVRSSVCLSLQTAFPFLLCHYVSTGRLHFTATPPLLPPNNPLQNYFQLLLAATAAAQNRANFLAAGGSTLLNTLELANSQLFLDVTETIVGGVSPFTVVPSEAFAAAAYALDNPLMPTLSNAIPISA